MDSPRRVNPARRVDPASRVDPPILRLYEKSTRVESVRVLAQKSVVLVISSHSSANTTQTTSFHLQIPLSIILYLLYMFPYD